MFDRVPGPTEMSNTLHWSYHAGICNLCCLRRNHHGSGIRGKREKEVTLMIYTTGNEIKKSLLLWKRV